MTSGAGPANEPTYEAYSRTNSYGVVWGVTRDHEPVSTLSEAEAQIIVFALNAVANSRHLARSTEIEPSGGFDQWEVYDGPTDGVVPK